LQQLSPSFFSGIISLLRFTKMTPEAHSLQEWLQKSSSADSSVAVGDLLAQVEPVLHRSSSDFTAQSQTHKSATKSPQLLWNRSILQCRTVDEFASIIGRFGSQFDSVNVATLLHQAAKVAPRQVRGQPFFLPLFQRAIALLDTDAFNAQALANTLWSLAKIFGSNPREAREQLAGLVAPLILRSTSRAREFKPQNVSNTVWALAKLGATCGGGRGDAVLLEPLLEALTQVSLAQISDFTAQNVSNSLWGLAKLGPSRVGANLAAKLLRQGGSIIEQFSPQHLSNSIWAVAMIGNQIEETETGRFLEMWQAKTGRCVVEFNSQDLSNCLWAMAKLKEHRTFDLQESGESPNELMVALLARTRAVVNEFNPLYVSSTLWALAVLCRASEDARMTGDLLLSRLNVSTLASVGTVEDVIQGVFAFARIRGGLNVPSELVERILTASRTVSGDPNVFALLSQTQASAEAFACAVAAWSAGVVAWSPLLEPLLMTEDVTMAIPNDGEHLAILTEALATASIDCKNSLDIVRLISEHLVNDLARTPTMSCHPRHAIRVCVAFATMEIYDIRLFSAVAEAVCLQWASEFKVSSELWSSFAELLWPVRSEISFWPHVLAKFLTLVYCPVLDRLRFSQLVHRSSGSFNRQFSDFPVTCLGVHFTREALKDLQVLWEAPSVNLTSSTEEAVFARVIKSAADNDVEISVWSAEELMVTLGSCTDARVVFERSVPTLATIERLLAAGVKRLALSEVLDPRVSLQVSADDLYEVRDAGYLPVNGTYAHWKTSTSTGDTADEGYFSFGASILRQRRSPGKWANYGLFRWRDENGEFVWYLSDLGSNFSLVDDADQVEDLFVAKEIEECRPPSFGWKAVNEGSARHSQPPSLASKPVWLFFQRPRTVQDDRLFTGPEY
jgi:hypothetical protein